MNKTEDKYIIGKKYGILILKEIFRDYDYKYNTTGRIMCKTECSECGRMSIMRASDLYRDVNNSCFCKMTRHNMYKSPLYSVYNNMKDRCYNERCHAYKNYGGRGIQISEDWLGDNGFINFMNWSVSNGYIEKQQLSIDRINIDGNYSKENCRWIPLGENVGLSNKEHPRIKKKAQSTIERR